jgi:hypothetical protein
MPKLRASVADDPFGCLPKQQASRCCNTQQCHRAALSLPRLPACGESRHRPFHCHGNTQQCHRVAL